MRMVNRRGGGEWDVDRTIDASLLGLWYFGMFAPDDPRIVATMEAVRDRLWVKTDVGGVARYEDDYYHRVSQDVENVPGNPWFICTLWLAQWYIATAQTPDDLKPALDVGRLCLQGVLDGLFGGHGPSLGPGGVEGRLIERRARGGQIPLVAGGDEVERG